MLYLGTTHTVVKVLVWMAWLSRVLANVGTQEDVVEAAIAWTDCDLDAFYKRHAAGADGEKLTRITAFTSKLVGAPSERKWTGKGAETWGLIC